jgi:type I restriction enzyme S subunit
LAHGNFLGKCGMILEDGKYVLNQRMGRIRLIDNDDAFFVHLIINNNQNYFKHRGQGSSQKHIYEKDFESFQIFLPNVMEQKRIADIILGVENQIDLLLAKLQKLKLQKQGMMQALLTGRIRLT